MGVTKFDNINARTTSVKIVTQLPTTPAGYYGAASNDVDSVTWGGGEVAMILDDSYHGMLYVQTQTSGTTAVWIRLLEKLKTSTSTSTSTSSSTSTSTSSTSSSTSTSTSTSTSSSSSTSSSTSTSSTTTA